MNILIADDEPFVVDIVTRLLHRAGHGVRVSSDGQEAWEAFQKEDFDIVITDLSMPKLDGLQLAAKIKARLPHQRVVLLTGEGDEGPVPPNVDYLLAKPIRGTALIDLLRRIAPVPMSVA